ncbi:MAG: replication initiator protein A [Gammaproteobacteria bacterium]|nr:replication initiator protein A [Gammaproteobacteria bacterium]
MTANNKSGQLELFSAIFTDVSFKDDRVTMEMPFLSLSKKCRTKPIEYENNGRMIRVTGGELGIASIFDWDLIIWLFSQIQRAKNRNLATSRVIRFHKSAYLEAVKSRAGGKQYKDLERTLTRLKQTDVLTNIRTEKGGEGERFSWIENYKYQFDEKRNLTWVIVQLPEWLYSAIQTEKYLLTLNSDYFLLTGGLERWLYRLIRKSIGKKKEGWKPWRVSTLHERSGSTRELKYFKRDLKKLVEKTPNLLDYRLEIKEDNDLKETCLFAYYNKKDNGAEEKTSAVSANETGISFLQFSTEVYEKGKKLINSFDDIYTLQALYAEDVDLPSGEGFLSWLQSRDLRKQEALPEINGLIKQMRLKVKP